MNKRNTSLIVAAVITGVLVLCFLGGRALVTEAVYPAENAWVRLSRKVARMGRVFFQARDVVRENETLKTEIAALRLAMQGSEREANGARAKPNSNSNWLAADILSRGGMTGVRNFLRIGKGSLDGVRVNDTCAVPDGLVGRVTEVTPHTAIVKMITDPTVRIACRIETADAAFGPVYGIVTGGSTHALSPETEGTVLYFANPLRVRHLKRDLELPPRAEVVTSGLGGVFPKGITVGWLLESPRKDANGLERTGEIIPAVDFPSLEQIFVRVSHEK